MPADTTKPEIVQKIESKGFWYVNIRPAKYKPERSSLNDCADIIRRTTVTFRGWDYPFHEGAEIQNGLNYVQGSVDWRSHVEIWRFYQSGQFVHKFATVEDLEPTIPENSLSIINTLYSLTEIYEFASRLSLNNVLDDKPTITIELHNMKGRKLVMLDPMRHLFKDYVCNENVLPHSKQYITTDLFKNANGIALDHTAWILERFGWSSPHIRNLLRDDQDKLLKMHS